MQFHFKMKKYIRYYSQTSPAWIWRDMEICSSHCLIKLWKFLKWQELVFLLIAFNIFSYSLLLQLLLWHYNYPSPTKYQQYFSHPGIKSLDTCANMKFRISDGKLHFCIIQGVKSSSQRVFLYIEYKGKLSGFWHSLSHLWYRVISLGHCTWLLRKQQIKNTENVHGNS